MSDGVTIQVVGDKELIAKLDRLEKRDARRVLRRAHRAAAKQILPKARGLAPVLRRQKGRVQRHAPGLLRRAIRVRAAKRSRKFIGAVVTIGKGFFKGETFYGGFQEWGWRTRRGRTIAGKLFMEEAAKRAGPGAAQRAIQMIKQGIEQAATR